MQRSLHLPLVQPPTAPGPLRPSQRPLPSLAHARQVVFFDSDPQAHAPFYYLLARLGLARVVTGALQLEVRKPAGQLLRVAAGHGL